MCNIISCIAIVESMHGKESYKYIQQTSYWNVTMGGVYSHSIGIAVVAHGSLHTHCMSIIYPHIIGNFKTQVISNVVSSICAIVLIFSTWQYTLNQPSCCPSNSENVTLNADHAEGCEEVQRNILLSSLNLHISSSVNITISIIALLVCDHEALVFVVLLLFMHILYLHTQLFATSTGILWIQSVFVADQFGDEGENVSPIL